MSYDSTDGHVKTPFSLIECQYQRARTPRDTSSCPDFLLLPTPSGQITRLTRDGDLRRHEGKRPHPEQLRSRRSLIGRILRSSVHCSRHDDCLTCRRCLYLGITMPWAVERDSQSRSNYAMCAVNPSRISAAFDDVALRKVVDTISSRCQVMLEIVDFNTEVCAFLRARTHHSYKGIKGCALVGLSPSKR